MLGNTANALHRIAPQPRLQARHQLCQGITTGGGGWPLLPQLLILAGQGLKLQHAQLQRLDRCLQAGVLQMLAQQRDKLLGIAAGCQHADLQRLPLAIARIHAQLQQARTCAMPSQKTGSGFAQAPPGKQQCFCLLHRIRQCQRLAKCHGWHHQRARIGLQAIEAIQLQQTIRPQPLRQPGTRQAPAIAQLAHAQPLQPVQLARTEA